MSVLHLVDGAAGLLGMGIAGLGLSLSGGVGGSAVIAAAGGVGAAKVVGFQGGVLAGMVSAWGLHATACCMVLKVRCWCVYLVYVYPL